MSYTPIVVSHSELDAIRQCGHKHDLAHRQRWSPSSTSPALSTGRVWHAALALHYGHIMSGSTDDRRRQDVAELLLAEAAVDDERADLVAWMYDGYEEQYGTDPQWEILAIEDQSLIRLPERNGRGSRFYLRMRLDLLVSEAIEGAAVKKRKIWVVDHKSGQNLPTDKELDLDDQFGLYTWGKRTLGVPVFGSIYSAARTQRNKVMAQPMDERFSRKRLFRTDQELDTIAKEAWQTARAAYRYKIGEAPRSPDTSPIGPSRCRAKCPFTEPCLMGRKLGPDLEREYLESAGFVQLTEDEQLAERGYPEPMMP